MNSEHEKRLGDYFDVMRHYVLQRIYEMDRKGHNSLVEIEPKEIDVDLLLDEYNDCLTLYEMFGDQKYQDKANEILDELKSMKS